jgi:prolyl 4-hydroxylase
MKNYLACVKWIFLVLLLWASHVTSTSHVKTESGETHPVDDALASIASSFNNETSNNCNERVSRGECETNSDFMVSHCASECIHSSFATTISLDPRELSSDDNANANDNANNDDDGTLKNDNDWNNTIQVEIGVQQFIHPDHSQDSKMIKATLENILKTNSYMQSFLPLLKMHDQELDDDDDDNGENKDDWSDMCVNEHAHCHSFAVAGKCVPPEHYDEDSLETRMFKFMMKHCAPACQTCHNLLEYDDLLSEHCQPDRSTDIFQPGDLDRMFERIVEEANEGRVPYTVHILSQPTSSDDTDVTATTASTAIHEINIQSGTSSTPLHNGPWIISIDNFITDEECNRLIELGSIEGYDSSGLSEEDEITEEELVGVIDEEDKYRTSTNAWCQHACYQDPIAWQVISKIESLTGIPDSYHEFMQLVRYTPGQYYKSHHDSSGDDAYTPEGPRILTVFLYLNDVEEGGETRFNDLAGDESNVVLDVHPRKGTALIWPSMLSESPNDKLDDRTFHEAMEVTKGVKYGANTWLHLRPFKEVDNECDDNLFDTFVREKYFPIL